MIPRGKLLLIGGAEDKEDNNTPEMKDKNKEFEQFEILKELLPDGNSKKRIEIITTASDSPEEMKDMYKRAFRKLGYTNVGFLNIENKAQARENEVCERVYKAHAVLFSGGDQFKLSALLGGTDCISAIKDKYNHDTDFVIAGTSAGAMVMSKIMIYEGGVNEALLKDDLKITSGIGIFDTCIIDTHFIKRGRFGRLAQAITMNPEALGVGLGEDTALIIKNGFEAECRGSGMVAVIDGNEIGLTNITEADKDTPIFVENLRVHLLAKGSRYNIKERKVYPPSKRQKAESHGNK
jgi:cyanophycinase